MTGGPNYGERIAANLAVKPTRKRAIDAMCMQCMGGPDNQGWTTLIKNCSAGPDSRVPCPLWLYRPYR